MPPQIALSEENSGTVSLAQADGLTQVETGQQTIVLNEGEPCSPQLESHNQENTNNRDNVLEDSSCPILTNSMKEIESLGTPATEHLRQDQDTNVLSGSEVKEKTSGLVQDTKANSDSTAAKKGSVSHQITSSFADCRDSKSSHQNVEGNGINLHVPYHPTPCC